VVDLAKTGAAILIQRPIAMILHAKAVNHICALPDVRNWVNIQIVHHIAGVIVHFDPFIIHFPHDLRTRFAGSGRTTMLLDHQQDSVIARDWAELLEPLDP
jgi:hypothetical protein